MVRDVGAKMLRKLGHTVTTFDGKNSVIEYYKQHYQKIDLIIMDIVMPDMHASDLFPQLKAVNPDVIVLLSSGYSLEEQAQELFKQGCRGFIQKPFNLKTLSAKLAEITDHRLLT